MDIQKIELMKSLQREYYGELRKKKDRELKARLKLMYRMVLVLLVSLLLACMFNH
jgi:hypothetical protein